MSRRGELELVIGTDRISAPAQHVANASALRASLVSFYLAFWEHVLKERGGLRLLLLDDPQELFDSGNRERFANGLSTLLESGAQIVVATYDARFAAQVTRANRVVEHRSVHPATNLQPVLRTPLSEAEILRRKALFEADPNAEEPARAFADGCRVFLEVMLGDLFDDPAYSAWVQDTPAPTLADYVNRLRGFVGSSPKGMFSAHCFRTFVDHAAVKPTSPTAKLLNKAHHQGRPSITPAEVHECAGELAELVKLADELHNECRRWRQREPDTAVSASRKFPDALTFVPAPPHDVPSVCPDLAAFTQKAKIGESQEPIGSLDSSIFASKALYYLRRDNFGFAAPQGSIAIVESHSLPAIDRSLVIARHGVDVYARRVLRSDDSRLVGLTAETLDPRRSPKTKFLPELEVALHQVVGVLFDHDSVVGPGKDEAILVEDWRFLKRIEIAYRVVEDSAIPLALPKQVVLGGSLIEPHELGQHEGKLAALALDDGACIFKRVGAKLPGGLSHLRQFESIGGLGSSEVLSTGAPQPGFRSLLHARLIVGVLYQG